MRWDEHDSMHRELKNASINFGQKA